MGPVIICDKSTLQALSRNELNILRRYYIVNIPPVLLVEILADLKKHQDAAAGRQEVRTLAHKLVPACSCVNVDFRKLIRGELTGHRFPMEARPVIAGGRHVSAPSGKKGVIFDVSEDAKALLRWQSNDFQAAEELMAAEWRLSTQAIDLEAMQRQLRGAYSGQVNLGTLAATVEFVDQLIASVKPGRLLEWFLRDARIISSTLPEVVARFSVAPVGHLTENAPYTLYCIRVALIFHFALAFGLVSTKPTNRVDLEYLYYAPFGHAFSSGDTLHRKIAGLVLTNQIFIPRDELKADLAQLARWWAGLSPEQTAAENRQSGPPENEDSVTHRAWKKAMKPGYREPDSSKRRIPEEVSAKLLQEYQEMIKDDLQGCDITPKSTDDCDFMLVKHQVRLNGPCICGSAKAFADCCGKGIAAAVARGEVEAC